MATLAQIIEAWWDLEVEEQHQSWFLTPLDRSCSWSPNKDLSHPTYVLTRKGDPLHLQRPHGVLEVVWGHCHWVTAIAFPKWINIYHCLGILVNACGPLLDQSCCAIWCDDTRLKEELAECHVGSFVQVHIDTLFSDLVRIDLQAALHRSMNTLPLPIKAPDDNLVRMKIFVPQGVTCYSGTSFDCISPFENWQASLFAAGTRAFPARDPDKMIFHRVHSAIDEVNPLFDPVTKHFILADSDEQESTRTVVFAVFSSKFEFIGACHWTRVTKVWDVFDLCGGLNGWVVYHNNQRLQHHKVNVHHGDLFSCYERSNCHTPFQADRFDTDPAQDLVNNAPVLATSRAAESSKMAPPDSAGTHLDCQEASPTFEQTGDPLLLIGRGGGRRSDNDQGESLPLRSFQ